MWVKVVEDEKRGKRMVEGGGALGGERMGEGVGATGGVEDGGGE